jgi:hypothetical protein
MTRASDLVSEYERIREELLAMRLDVPMNDRQYAGLWIHAFGDPDRALAVFDSSAREARECYLTRWPTLRTLLVSAAENSERRTG